MTYSKLSQDAHASLVSNFGGGVGLKRTAEDFAPGNRLHVIDAGGCVVVSTLPAGVLTVETYNAAMDLAHDAACVLVEAGFAASVVGPSVHIPRA
jgi:hypothetical protein